MKRTINKDNNANNVIRWMYFWSYFSKALKYSKDRNDNCSKMLARADAALLELLKGVHQDKQQLVQLVELLDGFDYDAIIVPTKKKKAAKKSTTVDNSGTLTLDKE